MSAAEILKKAEIKLNQNLWLLLVSLMSLGLSENFKLPALKVFSIILCSISTLSMITCVVFYTINYYKTKIAKWKYLKKELEDKTKS